MIGNNILSKIFSIDGFIQKPEGIFLHRLASQSNKKGVIVELGCFKGRSTICLGLAAKKKNIQVYAVDTFKGDRSTGYQNTLPAFKKNITKFKLNKTVSFKKGTTMQVGKKWKKPISYLFIDALHTYNGVKSDFTLWEKYVIDGGIIAFHDTLLPNPPRKVFERFVLKSRRYEIIGYQESTIAVKKVENIGITGIINNYYLYYIRDIKHQIYEIAWPIRKTASIFGIYHEKER